MTIPAVTSPTSSLYTTATTPTAKKTVDKELFLKLLVTQLRNQDPSSPMDTTQVMAQSTQLASMEQLTELATTSREGFALQMRIAALGMIGQQVSYLDEDGKTVTGTASAVSFTGSAPTVTVGDEQVALGAISAVTNTTSTLTA